ncbi:MAG: UDP-N-acetylglucosamine 1-carboxyvinyltransferase, partial [Bacteroidales bacterium]|nr:UDP-N-acetylglucosamine 1-carboxyvinyltransferase [Bacteroidales bacterium]
MSRFVIEGGHRLSGEIVPQGAKNEALEVISAVLLTAEPVTISNVPEILDIKNLIDLLRGMGVGVERHAKGEYTFTASHVNEFYIRSAEFVQKCAQLRGSVLVVGPLLARFGSAFFPKPGGDKIGRRRVDTHIEGFMRLGAKCAYDTAKQAYSLSSGRSMKGCHMLLDEASVTGTANIVMA